MAGRTSLGEHARERAHTQTDTDTHARAHTQPHHHARTHARTHARSHARTSLHADGVSCSRKHERRPTSQHTHTNQSMRISLRRFRLHTSEIPGVGCLLYAQPKTKTCQSSVSPSHSSFPHPSSPSPSRSQTSHCPPNFHTSQRRSRRCARRRRHCGGGTVRKAHRVRGSPGALG